MENVNPRKHDTYAFLETAGNVFLWLMGGLYVRGAHRVPTDRAVMLVSNHASYLDPVAIGVAAPRRVLFMTKAEIFDIRMFAWLLDGVDCFPVRRKAADLTAFKTALAHLKTGRCLCIFPEGTRSPNGQLQPAEAGAAALAIKTKVTLIPVYVHGSHKMLGLNQSLHRGRIDVAFGEPFVIDKTLDKDAAAAAVMAAIQHVAETFEEDSATCIRPHLFTKKSERGLCPSVNLTNV